MTATSVVEGAGEKRLRDRKRGFWKMVGQGLLLGAGIGALLGFVAGFTKGWEQAGGGWIGWAVWPVMAIGLWLFVRYTLRYFRRIDELDLLDNLWSGLIGLYAVVLAYPAWAVLHEIGQLPPPTALGMWYLALVAAALGYGWRKLRHRF